MTIESDTFTKWDSASHAYALNSNYISLRMSSYNLLPHDQISVNNEMQTLLWWEGDFYAILVAIDHIMCLDNETC